TRRQKFSSAARAPSAPSPAKPSTSTAAFIAPADVPEMPSMPSQGSSSRRSSTPQVKAPCAPPPCSAKSTRTGARLDATGPVVILLHQKVEPLPAGGPWWTDRCKNAGCLGDARGSSQRQQLETLFLLRRRPGGGRRRAREAGDPAQHHLQGVVDPGFGHEVHVLDVVGGGDERHAAARKIGRQCVLKGYA